MSKRSGVVAILGVAAAFLLTTTREWATGTSSDPILAGRRLAATGATLAPGAVAAALVVAAAALALATVGTRLRYVAAGLACVAALGVTGLALPVLQPAGPLGRVVAESVGRAGSTLSLDAAPTPWGVVGLVLAMGLPLLCAVVAWSSRRWHGLSSRFERPTAHPTHPDGRSTGGRKERGAWDALSEGHDPTVADPTGDKSTPT